MGMNRELPRRDPEWQNERADEGNGRDDAKCETEILRVFLLLFFSWGDEYATD